jgi:hypothetical protein
MPSFSLVTRASGKFEFLRNNIDRFRHDWSLLLSPKATRLESAAFALIGEFDSNGSFLNDLRIYLRYIDNGLTERTVEITERLAKHYCDFLRTNVGKTNFRALSRSFLENRVRYFDPNLSAAAVDARVNQLADKVFDAIPVTQPYQLGMGASIDEIDSYDWLLFIHNVIPVAAPDLTKVITEVDLRGLTNPFNIVVSSGPLDMKRSDRNDVGSKKTQGAVHLEVSFLYVNPLADEVADLKQKLDDLMQFMEEVDETIKTGIDSFNDVKQLVVNIETRSLNLSSVSLNNASVIADIKRRVDSLP